MEKERSSKKQIIPMVIGVLTMIILVSSATYAYFKVSIGNTGTSTTITGDIGGGTLGTVTLSGGGTNLYLGVSAYDMSESKKGTTYYSSTTEGNRETNVNNAGKTTYTATLSGDESDSVMYACDYEFTVTKSGTMPNISALQLVLEGDIVRTVSLNDSQTIKGTWYGFKKSNAERSFNAYLQLANTELYQNTIAGTNLSVEIKNTKWNCYLSELDELVGEAYAIEVNSEWDDMMEVYMTTELIFMRSETPIRIGDTYNGGIVANAYTGFESDKEVPWDEWGDGSSISRVVFEDEIRPISTANWFSNFTIDGEFFDLENLNFNRVTDMSGMFDSAMIYGELTINSISSLQNVANMFSNVNISGIIKLVGCDVSNATGISSMFNGINGDGTIDLSDWDTSNITNMSGWFAGEGPHSGVYLTGLDTWDTSNVTDMSSMFNYTSFSGVSGLHTWNVSNVTNMSGMFYDSYIDANLTNWDVSKVTNMSAMFAGGAMPPQVTGISNWNVSSVTNMRAMFQGYNRNDLDLSNWNVSNVTNMSSMFEMSGFSNLGDITKWKTGKVTDMSSMFANTYFPEDYSLNLSGWDVSKVTSYANFTDNENITPPNWPTTT